MMNRHYPGVPEQLRVPIPQYLSDRYKYLVSERRFKDAHAVSLEYYQGMRYYAKD